MVSSTNPGKQRRSQATAPAHKRWRQMTVRLDDDLLKRYRRRGLPIRKGDSVRIVRGRFRGEEGTIVRVLRDRGLVEIEDRSRPSKLILTKSDNKSVPRLFSPSNLVILKVTRSDQLRRLAAEGVVLPPEEPEEEVVAPAPDDSTTADTEAVSEE